jgi:hypothetical protein
MWLCGFQRPNGVLSKSTEPPGQVSGVQFTIVSVYLFICKQNDTHSVVVKMCGLQRSKRCIVRNPESAGFKRSARYTVWVLGSNNLNICKDSNREGGGGDAVRRELGPLFYWLFEKPNKTKDFTILAIFSGMPAFHSILDLVHFIPVDAFDALWAFIAFLFAVGLSL